MLIVECCTIILVVYTLGKSNRGEVIGLSVGGSTLLLIVIVVAITIVLVALIYKRKYYLKKKSGELCP